MPKQKSFVIQFRYIKPKYDHPFWNECFNNGEWTKWKAYKKYRDAENALAALQLPGKSDNFEYRHGPQESERIT